MSLNQWLEANGAPGSAVSVLLPDGSQVNVAAGSRDRKGLLLQLMTIGESQASQNQ